MPDRRLWTGGIDRHGGGQRRRLDNRNKDYSSQRFVRLDQITPNNVQDLGEICEIRLNAPTFFSSGLLKVDKTLYVNTYRTTYAIDATSCKLLWASPITVVNPITTNNSRGSAYLNGRLFRGTPDGALIALDASTGKVLWTNRTAADPNAHETFVSAPIAWNGKVFTGIAVGDAGIAGRLMAFDAKSGKELWHFNTTLGFNAGGAFGRPTRSIRQPARCSDRLPIRFRTSSGMGKWIWRSPGTPIR